MMEGVKSVVDGIRFHFLSKLLNPSSAVSVCAENLLAAVKVGVERSSFISDSITDSDTEMATFLNMATRDTEQDTLAEQVWQQCRWRCGLKKKNHNIHKMGTRKIY